MTGRNYLAAYGVRTFQQQKAIHDVFRQRQQEPRKSSAYRSSSAKKQLFSQEKRDDRDIQRRVGKRLEDFERYLARKQAGESRQQPQQKIRQPSRTMRGASFDKMKENVNEGNLPKNHQTIGYPMTTASSHLQSIHLQSEAFESFTNDFSIMKKTLLQLSHKVTQQAERVTTLEVDVQGLKTENLKLLTDMKVLRNEHQEVLNSLFTQERRNQSLASENEALKRMLIGGYPSQHQQPPQYSMDLERKSSPPKQEPHRDLFFPSMPRSQSRDRPQQQPTEASQQHRQGYSGDLVSFQPSHYAFEAQLLKAASKELQEDFKRETNGVRQSIRGNLPSTYHNPLLSVSGERNQSQAPPHLLQAHTLGNVSRVTSSRQMLLNEQSPTSPVPVPAQSAAYPSETEGTEKRHEEYMLARQRSLNALTTNLPSTMPPTGMGSKRMGGSGQKQAI